MTTATVPAMSSEHRDPLFQNTKNVIASLTSKNEEFLDRINQLQHSHSQALTAINNQLETIPHADGSVDNLLNNLKSKQRRNNNLQQQSKSDKDVVDDYKNKMNETETITADNSISSKKSTKLSMASRNIKESKKIENLTPNNNGGELDWKYFSTENNSDSERNSSSPEDKDFDDNNSSSRRRILKGHPTLTINTKNTKLSQRLITPESSDSEFDLSNAHMPLAPTLGGIRNPLRVARHSSAEHYNGNIAERNGRASNSLFSMDDVIEEEKVSLSDVAEQNENSSESVRSKQLITSVNGKKLAQKNLDDYNVGNDMLKSIKINRKHQTDDSYADIPDDNSSVMSADSLIQLEELRDLRARIQKLESERADDDERKNWRRKKNTSDSIISPAALSPDGSQGGTSSTTSFPRRSSTTSAQHQKHLQNAFDMFEKAFITDHPENDLSPPPSHSMAMVVSLALSLNQKLRSVMTQMELEGQLSETGLKALLKTSDEQVRSLTECLLALTPLAQKRVSTKKSERDQLGIKGHAYYPGDPTLLQIPTPSNSTRSISPIPKISSMSLDPHESQIGDHVDQHSSRRVSPTPPSPPNSYFVSQRLSSRYSRVPSRPSSPTSQTSQNSQSEYNDSSRVLERKSRRSSGTAYNSYSSVNFVSSPSSMQHSYYEREIPREAPRELARLQRYNIQGYNNITPQPVSSAYQRVSRPLSLTRTDSSTSSTSSINLSSSGRYASRSANEEYVSNPISATRSQPPSRLYEYTRRYPSDGQPPIERRSTPGLDTDRRYSRRIINHMYEAEDGYDCSNGYEENLSERDYIRDDKLELKRNVSNGKNTYRQRMVPAQEQEVNSNIGAGNGQNLGECNRQDDEINHDDGRNVQVSSSNVENGEENDGYI